MNFIWKKAEEGRDHQRTGGAQCLKRTGKKWDSYLNNETNTICSIDLIKKHFDYALSEETQTTNIQTIE